MTVTLREVAEWVDGEVVGDPSRIIRAARPLSDSPGEDDVTVVVNEKYLSQFQSSQAGVGVVDGTVPPNGKALIRVADPLTAFVTIVQRLHVKPIPPSTGTHPTASIHPTATIGSGCSIAPFVVIGEGCIVGEGCRLENGVSIAPNCKLGNEVHLAPHVVLYPGTVLGNRVVIHANSVIGADGFGYRLVKGKHLKVPQVGTVEIGDDVEIGACSTVDRATFGTTRVGAGTKIDNHVQVGHNCQIGRHNILAGQSGIAGSVTTGDYVIMGGQVGVADHARIGDRTMVGAKSGVHGDIEPDQKLLGAPATLLSDQLRIMHSLEKLPEMRKDLRAIKKQLGIE